MQLSGFASEYAACDPESTRLNRLFREHAATSEGGAATKRARESLFGA